MPSGRLTARERIGRSLGVGRRVARSVLQRVRNRGGAGEAPAERVRDIIRRRRG